MKSSQKLLAHAEAPNFFKVLTKIAIRKSKVTEDGNKTSACMQHQYLSKIEVAVSILSVI